MRAGRCERLRSAAGLQPRRQRAAARDRRRPGAWWSLRTTPELGAVIGRFIKPTVQDTCAAEDAVAARIVDVNSTKGVYATVQVKVSRSGREDVAVKQTEF